MKRLIDMCKLKIEANFQGGLMTLLVRQNVQLER